MTRSRKSEDIFALLVLLIFPFIISACSGKRNNKINVEVRTTEKNDSTLLFNGKDLDGWEITNFGPQGPVYVSGGSIILGMGEGCTGITWKKDFPRENYMLTLQAKRVSGHDFFCGMTFPVGDSFCSLIVGGWAGSVVGLSSINGLDASENETKVLKNFENDRWYKICLIVKPDSIKASIDDNILIDFAIGNKKLSIRPEVQLSRPFGIASWTTTAALKNIRLTILKTE
jgi:hypothetical protein